MDWKRFDRARRTVGQEGLDLIESYAEGRINRRDFVRRGTVIGFSVPFLGAVIAACGGDDDDATTDGTDGATGTAPAAPHDARDRPLRAPAGPGPGGIIRVATQKPAGPLDPIAMQDLGTYGIIAQCFEFLCTLGDEGTSRPGSPSRGSRTRTAASGRSICARASSGTTAPTSRRPTSPPRSTASSAADNAGLKGVIGQGSVDATDPATWPSSRCSRRTATSRTSCRCTTRSP